MGGDGGTRRGRGRLMTIVKPTTTRNPSSTRWPSLTRSRASPSSTASRYSALHLFHALFILFTQGHSSQHRISRCWGATCWRVLQVADIKRFNRLFSNQDLFGRKEVIIPNIEVRARCNSANTSDTTEVSAAFAVYTDATALLAISLHRRNRRNRSAGLAAVTRGTLRPAWAGVASRGTAHPNIFIQPHLRMKWYDRLCSCIYNSCRNCMRCDGGDDGGVPCSQTPCLVVC